MSVDASSRMESSRDHSSGTKIILRPLIYTNPLGSSALRDITNAVLQGTAVDQPAAIHEPVFRQAEGETAFQPEDTKQVDTC